MLQKIEMKALTFFFNDGKKAYFEHQSARNVFSIAQDSQAQNLAARRIISHALCLNLMAALYGLWYFFVCISCISARFVSNYFKISFLVNVFTDVVTTTIIINLLLKGFKNNSACGCSVRTTFQGKECPMLKFSIICRSECLVKLYCQVLTLLKD